MDEPTRESNPRDEAFILSNLTFWWLTPLLKKGCKRPLEKEDLYPAQKQDLSWKLGNAVGRNWDSEVALSLKLGRKPRYVRALFRTFGFYFFMFGLCAFAEECIFRIISPILLGYLIRYFRGGSEISETSSYLIAAAITISPLLLLMVHHPYFFGTQCTGMRMRIASCALIYRKALKLSSRSLGKTTVGQLVNLLSNDVSRFDTSVLFLHYLWIGPLQTIITTAILWQRIGPSCLAGIIIFILYVPLQSYMGRIFSKLRLETACRTDERIRFMNEMVNAMRVIKMYAWEKPFNKVVEEARRREINVIMKSNYFRAITLTLYYTSAKMVIFISLLVYVFTGNVLTAEEVFVTSSLINNLRLGMTLFFPFAISLGSETLISCRRIQTFLEREEREQSSDVTVSKVRPRMQHCSIEGSGIYARWDPASGEDDLCNISFSVKAGEVMTLIGPVGAGKSSLLQAILRELPIKKGTIQIRGRIAYASQDPWIFAGSVKENILFGHPYNPKRYCEVIRVCALERDMKLFPDEDRTMVGDRGMSLSGGQKARINLARAVYSDSDIYLLDDPLSAVDAHVGKHLFEECISGFLRHKVVILATHQVQFTKNASHILVLRNGYTTAQGTYNQLQNTGVLTLDEELDEADAMAMQKSEEDLAFSPYVSKVTKLRRASQAWGSLHGSAEPEELGNDVSNLLTANVFGGSCVSIQDDDIDDMEEERKDERAGSQESKGTGSVSFKIYFKYFMAGGGFSMVFATFSLSVLSQMLYSGSDYWLSFWTNMEQLHGKSSLRGTLTNTSDSPSNETNSEYVLTYEDRLRYVNIYTGITVLLVVVSLIRTILVFRMCMFSSRKLHNKMFSAVLNAPMDFFEKHPIGQILNRFTKDTGQVDDQLPPTLFDYLTIILIFIGIISMILYLNFYIVIPTIILGFVFFALRWVYLSSARDIKRLEGITRSPVFTHLSSTFQGLATIRAFGQEAPSSDKFDEYQDIHTSAWFLFICLSRQFGSTLDFLSAIYIAVVTFSFMFQRDSLSGDVGLGISLAMTLSGMLQWGVRQSAELENQMTSVERMLEYSKLPSEHKMERELVPKPDKWPENGMISFKNVYLYYNRDEAPVLKNLNFQIKAGEKVGIVGRTGAGKSSLISVLFRLTPPDGEIMVDGVGTDTVLLQELRKSVSIIPQEPTLFTGTVRYNLDPFGQYPDEDIWNALSEAQLKETVSEMNGQLSAEMSEGGSNLSVGQRQLVCLARAVLKHNKVLVMDEATANVDPQTDSWIQEKIREKFKDCTVLTIAHRLNTIMDSDRIMVMDSGKLEEFDHPHILLQDRRTIFSNLVDQTGISSAVQLRKIAEETYQKLQTKKQSTEIQNSSANIKKITTENGINMEDVRNCVKEGEIDMKEDINSIEDSKIFKKDDRKSVEESGIAMEYTRKSTDESGIAMEDSRKSVEESGIDIEYARKSTDESGIAMEDARKSVEQSEINIDDIRSVEESGIGVKDARKSVEQGGILIESDIKSAEDKKVDSVEENKIGVQDVKKSVEESGVDIENDIKSAEDKNVKSVGENKIGVEDVRKSVGEIEVQILEPGKSVTDNNEENEVTRL